MNKLAVYLFMGLLLAIGCKSRKVVTAPPKVEGRDTVITMATAEDLLSFTLKDWKYFSAKINVDFTSGENTTNATVHVRMLKDSLVWLSAGLVGIEGARILINKDSMVLLDKLNRKYKVFKKDQMTEVLDVPLSVDQVQNLILARPVYALKLYQVMVNNETSLDIQYNQERYATSHSYAKSVFTIDTTAIRDRTSRNYATASYTNYSVIDGFNFPLSAEIKASNGVSMVDIKMNFEDVDFVKELTFPFAIPASYEKAK